MPRALDYTQGKIYKVTNTINNEFYVGSTCSTLNQRMTKHRYSATHPENSAYNMKVMKAMRDFGLNHFIIELIENFPCENYDALVTREQYYIDLLHPQLNINDAKGDHAKKNHERYIAKKDEIKEKQKQYLENGGKEKANIAQQKRREIKYECGCGGFYRGGNRLLHEKTEQHQAFLNGTLIKKEPNCPCGGHFTIKNKSIHEKTPKHKEWLEQQQK